MKREEILIKAFLAGAADLARRASLLDSINVFPVADADTGTNMSQTLKAAAGQLESLSEMRRGDLFKTLGQTLVKGARGNSGVIFSQFLAAFFDSLDRDGELSCGGFARGAASGRDWAFRNVANPEKGTILTTISDFAQILNNIESIDTLEAHSAMEAELARSVRNTPLLMPRLKRAGVVDAGALGFYIFSSGLTLALPAFKAPDKYFDYIQSRLTGPNGALLNDISDAIDPSYLESVSNEHLDYRYCVNLLLRIRIDPAENWKVELEKLGSSLDAAMTDGLIKIHMHSNDPSAVRAACEKTGEILAFEFEDMDLKISSESSGQIPEAPKEHMKLRVVGDSSMSLPIAMQKALGIRRIENYVGTADRMVRDCDIDLREMLAGLHSGRIYKTASTSAGEVEEFLDRMLSESDNLIYIAVGNAYTGTQNLVRKAVENHSQKNRITVLDSRSASGQMGLVCLTAARYLLKTSDLNDLIRYINNQIACCREYLVIDDLKYLSRTGRIGRIKAALAGTLSVKPIVGHGGQGPITYAKALSHEGALAEISKRVADHPGTGRLIAMIEHTDNQDWAAKVRERLETLLPAETEFIVCPLSSTSAAHMGPGTWGVAATRIPPDE